MLSGYMTGPRVCGYMHRRQVNTRKHKTELAYIGRAPFKRRPRSPASSLVDFFRRSQQPRAADKFLGLVGFPRRPRQPPPLAERIQGGALEENGVFETIWRVLPK